MMNILLNIPRNLDKLSFVRGPATGDDEYNVDEIKTSEVIDERVACNSGEGSE